MNEALALPKKMSSSIIDQIKRRFFETQFIGMALNNPRSVQLMVFMITTHQQFGPIQHY